MNNYYSTPENAMKRADEALLEGNWENALDCLHEAL